MIGIYAIINKVNRRVYIGQSQDIEQRYLDHIFHLDRGTHHSFKLQRSWDMYGKEKHVHMVIEIIDNLSIMNEREQFWMNKTTAFTTGFNCQPIAGSARGYKRSEEDRLVAAENLRKLAKDPEERKRRSDRAKRQHKEGTLGFNTWKTDRKDVGKKVSDSLKNHPKRDELNQRSRDSWTPERRAEAASRMKIMRENPKNNGTYSSERRAQISERSKKYFENKRLEKENLDVEG